MGASPDSALLPATAPWSPQGVAGAPAARTKLSWSRALPFVGPIILFLIWDLVVRAGFVKPILLPPPLETLKALVNGLAGGPLLKDFTVTLWRTFQAFMIAAVIGMPLALYMRFSGYNWVTNLSFLLTVMRP